MRPGDRFGRLTFIRELGKRGHEVAVECACDCGTIAVALRGNVRSGATSSCGCFRREATGALRRTHGLSRTAGYAAWRDMHERCSDSRNPAYHCYGGRGIKVCRRWSRVENFIEDMGQPPDGLTLDRRNNERGYSPSNCRWATRAIQAQNTRTTKLTINDVRAIREQRRRGLTGRVIAAAFGISRGYVYNIIHQRNWKEGEQP